jgi:DNA polymerase III subunit epsilon
MSWLSRLLGGAAQKAVVLTPAQRQAIADWRAVPPVDGGRSHYLSRYVVVDVETSGLNMEKDQLISIGAVAVVNGVIDFHDVFQVVLRQEVVSTDANILIHGIGGSAQREGVDPPDALIAFLQYLGKAPLVAYHALFDQTMIERAMQEFLGIKLGQTWIDLAWVMPDLFRERIAEQVGLDDWLKLFGIENIQRHNAVADAYATAMLLQVAMARGAEKRAESPASFVTIEKSRRWMRRGS